MSKFYTSRGDQGETDHLGKGRLSKSHIRIQTVGALDEASAALGFARAQISDPAIDQLIKTAQTDLYRIMSIVSLEKPDPDKIPDLEADRVVWLEEQIDHFGSQTESPKGFILPGENLPAGAIGLARAIVRRAERDLVALERRGIIIFRNRPFLSESTFIIVLCP